MEPVTVSTEETTALAMISYSLHVKIENETLDEMLEEIAQSVWEALIEQPQPHQRSSFELMKNAIKASLRQYIVGISGCGLNPICQRGKEFNPWENGKQQT